MGQQNNNNILQSSRIKEWWIPKAGNLLAMIFLIVAICQIPFPKTVIYFLPSIITIIGIGGFGHMINDWLDIPSDKKAEKKNRMASLGLFQRFFVVVLFLLLAFVPWIFLPFDLFSILILAFEFSLLILYAIPPFRLKEKSILGVITDGLYAYAVPSILASYTYFLIAEKDVNFILLGIIFAWQFFMGMHNIIIHQIEDYENDLQSNTLTFIVQNKFNKKTILVKKIIFYLEILFFVALISYMSITFYYSYWIIPFIILCSKYFPLLYSSSFDVFHHSKNPRDLQIINIKYHTFLPYLHLLYSILFQVNYFLFLGITFLLLTDLKQFKHNIPFYATLKNVASVAINYSIFWYRINIKKESTKKALREFYDENIFGPIPSKKHSYNLALINKNPEKYTETFVKNHLIHLPFNVHFYYGKDSYFPQYNQIGHLLTDFHYVSQFFSNLIKEKNLAENYYLEKAFQKDLIKNKIDIVLAEFGTTGAAISQSCTDIGKPLVCIFHGYDAHHKNVRETNQLQYQNLFKNAKLIIAVSKDIMAQLEKIGAPKNKLRYLPCGINLDLFQYSDHSKNPPIFLMVGRLAITKSPHLSILAFQKVLETIPKAKLIIIGQDEGGELFEACLIMVKALGIAQQVEFRGIQSPEAVHAQMKQSRAFIQHSLTTPINGDKEGTPVSIMEAMASGLPVISTRHAGIAEIIENGKTGLLVEEYHINQMANDMIKIANDDALAKKLGKNASEAIKNNPLISHHIEELNQLLLSVIRE